MNPFHGAHLVLCKEFLAEWFPGHGTKRLDDLELAVCQSFPYIDIVDEMMIFLHRHLSAWRLEFQPVHRLSNLVDVKRAGFFDSVLPEINPNAREIHRTAGDTVFPINPGHLIVNPGN